MVWVLVFAGIALVGLVMLVCWIVWLAHKTADVLSEVRVLADRTGQLADLLAGIEQPAPPAVRLAESRSAAHGSPDPAIGDVL